MINYRRSFVPGGSFFFTVNLADRRQRLLTEHIDELRSAFRRCIDIIHSRPRPS
jgi:putative transposase